MRESNGEEYGLIKGIGSKIKTVINPFLIVSAHEQFLKIWIEGQLSGWKDLIDIFILYRGDE